MCLCRIGRHKEFLIKIVKETVDFTKCTIGELMSIVEILLNAQDIFETDSIQSLLDYFIGKVALKIEETQAHFNEHYEELRQLIQSFLCLVYEDIFETICAAQ